MTEAPDIVPPTVTGATLNYTNGALAIALSEFADLTPSSGVLLLDRIFVANNADGQDIVLESAEHEAVLFALRSDTVHLQLTELQRVKALALSGTPGGDGTAIVLNILGNALQDFGGIGNLQDGNVTVIESDDILKPTILSAQLDYGNGVLIVDASETIDATPDSLVNLGNMKIVQASGSAPLSVSLEGASVNSTDFSSLTITLTEEQRIGALFISNTPGGGGTGFPETDRQLF